MSLRFNFCRSVPPEFLRSFLFYCCCCCYCCRLCCCYCSCFCHSFFFVIVMLNLVIWKSSQWQCRLIYLKVLLLSKNENFLEYFLYSSNIRLGRADISGEFVDSRHVWSNFRLNGSNPQFPITTKATNWKPRYYKIWMFFWWSSS